MGLYDFLGRGFHFPPETENSTGRFRSSEGEADIREAVFIILGTRKGERVMRPDFGCDIHQYVFGTMDFTSMRMMERSVTEALVRWEPRIREIEADAVQSDQDGNLVLIQIRYIVRTTNNPYNLVYPFYMNEGIKDGI